MDSRKTFARQLVKRSAVAAAAFMVAAGAGAQDATPINGNLPPGALPSSWDSAYNVCRGTDAKCYHDWVGAANRLNRVLIYTRTAGPRHASIGTPLAAGLNPPLNADNVTQASLIAWLAALGIGADYTEDASILGSINLNQYKAVVFVSNSRDAMQKHGTAANTAIASDLSNTVYADQAKTNLRQYIRAGGGFVAIHNAFGTEYNWPWYEGLLGNANYYSHGPEQNATMKLVGTADSSTTGLPSTIAFKDEWYDLMPYPTKVKFLVTVDDSTYGTGPDTNHPGHGAFHPVAWCQYYDGGRAWLTTLGHDTAAWTDGSGFVGQVPFKQLILQGVQSAMGLTAFCKK